MSRTKAVLKWQKIAMPLDIADIHIYFPLRQAREAREVWFALLEKGVFAFLAFFCHVVEHGGIASQFLDASQPICICVEGRFQETQCKRALLQYFFCPLDCLLFHTL